MAASLLPTTIATVLMLDVGEAAAMTVAREVAASLPLATVTTVLALYEEEEAATLTAVGGVAASLPLTTVAIALPLEGGVERERRRARCCLARRSTRRVRPLRPRTTSAKRCLGCSTAPHTRRQPASPGSCR